MPSRPCAASATKNSGPRVHVDLEVIDLRQQSALAARDHVVAVPTLIRRFPGPLRRIVGDLTDAAWASLGLDVGLRRSQRRPRLSRTGNRHGQIAGCPGPSSPAPPADHPGPARRRAPNWPKCGPSCARLQQTIEAIRTGGVDSLIIGPPGQEQVYSLATADRPYRLIVEAMSEGAATVSTRGVILNANPRLALMTGRTASELIGTPVLDLIPGAHRPGFRRR